ncbi:MAG TPA: hypothetical protein VGR57_09505, partial [Ktedonobacterales bacterium]|nr:hypothetical protein [Ktedonobacterales bacterium]
MASQNQPSTAPGGANWPARWNALDQPWRTEPEIGAERQAWLATRRASVTSPPAPPLGREGSAGDYPFAGVR